MKSLSFENSRPGMQYTILGLLTWKTAQSGNTPGTDDSSTTSKNIKSILTNKITWSTNNSDDKVSATSLYIIIANAAPMTETLSRQSRLHPILEHIATHLATIHKIKKNQKTCV
jgi:hypothetical protein